MKLFKSFVALSAAAFITGCATESDVQAEAKNINITKKSISRLCQWRGKVSISNEALRMNTPSQHTSLESQEFNMLKLQAAKLGANTIVLSSSSGMSQKTHWAAKSEHKYVASHAYEGQAYWCP